MSPVSPTRPRRLFEIQLNGKPVQAPDGSTLLDACRRAGADVPTLCFLDGMSPLGACRLCVVEVEGSRALVPACERKVEPGMKVRTESERVQLSRRLLLELLSSSVDLSRSPEAREYMERCGARPARFGEPPPSAARVDNELFVRDMSHCVLCYRCVAACGDEAQHTFAISVAGRGDKARIATEFDGTLPDSACVYCGNCVGVCPTGALLFRSEHEMREAGTWDEARQAKTDTVCPYCGVGCVLTLHVQDNAIVKVTSPRDDDTTRGHLCIKGRFGWQFVQAGKSPERD
jgi:NADH dehydrogenase/NADH:ubiquinone oxidoreductase subunit G